MIAATLQPTFSFYVGPSRSERIVAAASFGDAVTVAGKGGPEAVRKLRLERRLDAAVIFDRRGYELGAEAIDVLRWIDEQHGAGADRALTCGKLVRYSRSEPSAWKADLKSELILAEELDATALVALDARILARLTSELIGIANDHNARIALVLVDAQDPLSVAGATEGLTRLVRATDGISVLRSDHGAIAVPAFGGAHASIGLSGHTRHYSMGRGRAKPTRTNRVFVPYYLDWFTADLIAGWAAAGRPISCSLPCCRGERLDRFFDDRLNPLHHNMTSIAAFADYVLNAEEVDRPRTFLEEISRAHSHYDIDGLHGPTSKAQLNAWALL